MIVRYSGDLPGFRKNILLCNPTLKIFLWKTSLKCIGNVIPIYNKEKSLIFESTVTVIFKIHMFTCASPAVQSTSLP